MNARNILSQMDEISLHNFVESTYTSDRGKEYPMFNLTKEGCLCLVSGYDANNVYDKSAEKFENAEDTPDYDEVVAIVDDVMKNE